MYLQGQGQIHFGRLTQHGNWASLHRKCVEDEMARVSIDILGISELKWTGGRSGAGGARRVGLAISRRSASPSRALSGGLLPRRRLRRSCGSALRPAAPLRCPWPVLPFTRSVSEPRRRGFRGRGVAASGGGADLHAPGQAWGAMPGWIEPAPTETPPPTRRFLAVCGI